MLPRYFKLAEAQESSDVQALEAIQKSSDEDCANIEEKTLDMDLIITGFNKMNIMVEEEYVFLQKLSMQDLSEENFFEIVTQLIQNISIGRYHCFLDEERRLFLNIILPVVYRLERNSISGNSHHRLVMGPKGTGKSSFLNAICLAIQYTCASVFAIYLDINDVLRGVEEVTLPQIVLRGLLQAGMISSQDIDNVTNMIEFGNLVRMLRKKNLKVFLVIDEYHIAYCINTPRSNLFMLHVYHAINDRSGTLMVTVCGSSPYLRSLCFGKSFPRDVDMFPAYCGHTCNLNSTRTHVHSLGPILLKNEFIQYVEQYQCFSEQLRKDESNGSLLFLISGGIRETIDELASTTPEQWVTPLKSFSTHKLLKKWGSIWAAMMLFFRHQLSLRERVAQFEIWEYMSWIDCTDITSLISDRALVRKVLGEWDDIDSIFGVDFTDLGRMFSGTDEGAFVFQLTQSGSRIRFVVPYHYEFMRGIVSQNLHLPPWFTLYNQICLVCPYGVLGTDAKDVVARCLFMQIFPHHEFNMKTLCVKFVNTKIRDTIESITVDATRMDLNFFENFNDQVIFKELPDWIGGDLVVIKDSKEFRYQVNLGKQPVQPKDASEIVQKLNKGISLKQKYFKRESGELFGKYLITSRPMSSDVLKLFAEQSVHVIHMSDLLPESIRHWAEQLGHLQYVQQISTS